LTNVPTERDQRVREAAAEQSILDVAWAMTDSPLGDLLVAATPRGLCRISFDPDLDAVLRELAASFGGRVVSATGQFEELRRDLDLYFDHGSTTFESALDLGGASPFQLEALGELRHVPYGQTATYGELAVRLGRPRATRAVGGAMNRNPIPIVLPCHRVVGSQGELTGYAGGLDRKRQLLALEGAMLGHAAHVDV